jgi:hypothetical protein
MSASDVAVLLWRVSSWSNSSGCIEVANSATTVFVRDSKNRDGGALSFAPTAWEGFINTIRTEPQD